MPLVRVGILTMDLQCGWLINLDNGDGRYTLNHTVESMIDALRASDGSD